MAINATHPQYGGREIKPSQVVTYQGTGWSVDLGDARELVEAVAGDPDAAAAVLAAEKAGKNRKTVTTALEPSGQEA